MQRQIILLAALASASAFAPSSVLPTRSSLEAPRIAQAIGSCALLYRCRALTKMPTRRLQRPAARCLTVAQQQRHGAECQEAYTLRLREASGAARVMQALPSAAVLSQIVLPVQHAAAANGELGLLEGKGFALIHPLIMAGLYLTTILAGYQGLKWRELRTMGDDMKPLQAQVKELEDRIAQYADGEYDTSADQAALAPLKAELEAMQAKRKELSSAGYRDKHFALSSILLGIGITFTIEGGVDTYMRAGKLFPGPHLFAGAGIVVLWAVAASLVPKMQKGEDWARSLHIGINAIILGLFTWQLPTGFDILNKVWTKVPWVPVLKVAETAANAPNLS